MNLDSAIEDRQKDVMGAQLAASEEQCGQGTRMPLWIFNYC